MRVTTPPAADDIAIQQAVMAYASDMSLLSTSMRPHGAGWRTPGLQSASLDHAIWFHRPSNFNDWHLYAQKSPSASGARGFNLGEIYNIDGRLVASTAQEGLTRLRRAGPRSADVPSASCFLKQTAGETPALHGDYRAKP